MGIALVAASASIAAPAGAATPERFEDGLAAYQRNDFEKSLKLLRPLAEKGDARAQYILGRQYQFGQGVKVDRAEAYYWYKRAEAKGHNEAKLFRLLLEKRWNISAADKARGEKRLAEATAPPKRAEKPERKVEKAEAKPKSKPKPEKPREVAAREPTKPSITSKPTERVPPESAKPAEPAKPAVEAARARIPERAPETPPGVASKPAPPDDEPPAIARTRTEPPRPPARRDDDEDEADTATAAVPPATAAPPPAETRTALPPVERATPPVSRTYATPGDGYRVSTYPLPYEPPGETSYTPPPPSYAPAYTEAPPYYAPAAPPTWRPPPYYGRGYYGPGCCYQPYRAYAGWRMPGWRGHPGRGFRFGRW